MTRIVIVNEKDEVIGAKERSELVPSDIYRVAVLWMTSSKGEVLLAQRALSKKKQPGKWGPAVAGTVDEGEDYDSNIVKEIGEEIGLVVPLSELTLGPMLRVAEPTSNHFDQYYQLVIDKPADQFTLCEIEVAQVAWFTPEQLRHEIETTPEKFTPSADKWIDMFLS